MANPKIIFNGLKTVITKIYTECIVRLEPIYIRCLHEINVREFLCVLLRNKFDFDKLSDGGRGGEGDGER